MCGTNPISEEKKNSLYWFANCSLLFSYIYIYSFGIDQLTNTQLIMMPQSDSDSSSQYLILYVFLFLCSRSPRKTFATTFFVLF